MSLSKFLIYTSQIEIKFHRVSKFHEAASFNSKFCVFIPTKKNAKFRLLSVDGKKIKE